MTRQSVAVIGAGVLGITAIKNLLEEGFNVTGFDKNDYIGGLWHFSQDTKLTTATECTRWNSCSQMSCYTDFPFPPGTPDFPDFSVIQSYLQQYCTKFSLHPHIKLSHTVTNVSRHEDHNQWLIKYVDNSGVAKERFFNKVVVASGQNAKPVYPEGITGFENFKGEILHGQAFKRAEDYGDKNVLILGASNTAMDCAVDLSEVAQNVYLSHRHGNVIVPRYYDNMPVEFQNTLRLQALGRIIGKLTPSGYSYIFNRRCFEISTETFGSFPIEWRFNNLPPNGQMCNPVINDRIIEVIRGGRVKVVSAMQEITSEGEIELRDGTLLSDIDTIILCTGYKYDFSFLSKDIDPSQNVNKRWAENPASNGRPLSRLYKGIFSLEYPESLAFLGLSGYTGSQMPLADLVSMAIGQVWKGTFSLPKRHEMIKDIDAREKWMIGMIQSIDSPTVLPGLVRVGPWMQWLHNVAGTGVNEKLGYGWQGWWYWLTNYRSASAIMNGISVPYLWRLFDGRRKRWDGAEKAIKEANQLATAMKAELAYAKKTG